MFRNKSITQYDVEYREFIEYQMCRYNWNKWLFNLPISAISACSSSSPRNHDDTTTNFRTCSGIKHRKNATFPKNTSFPSTRMSYGCLTTAIKVRDVRWKRHFFLHRLKFIFYRCRRRYTVNCCNCIVHGIRQNVFRICIDLSAFCDIPLRGWMLHFWLGRRIKCFDSYFTSLCAYIPRKCANFTIQDFVSLICIPKLFRVCCSIYQ